MKGCTRCLKEAVVKWQKSAYTSHFKVQAVFVRRQAAMWTPTLLRRPYLSWTAALSVLACQFTYYRFRNQANLRDGCKRIRAG